MIWLIITLSTLTVFIVLIVLHCKRSNKYFTKSHTTVIIEQNSGKYEVLVRFKHNASLDEPSIFVEKIVNVQSSRDVTDVIRIDEMRLMSALDSLHWAVNNDPDATKYDRVKSAAVDFTLPDDEYPINKIFTS